MNKHEKYLYILVCSLFVLMIGFQNCDSSTSLLSSKNKEHPAILQDTSFAAIEDALSTSIKPIRATLVSDDAQTPRDYFSIYSNIKLSLTDLLPESSQNQSFTWNIEKIFPQGVVFQHTVTNEQSEYIYTFPQVGVYDVSVTSHQEENANNAESIRGHKKLVVGLCNENQNILEITLSEGTLQPNTKSAFTLSYFDENEATISNVLWQVTHHNKNIATSNDNDPSRLVTQWDNISGETLVEIFAQFEGNDCIFHRQRWVNIDQNIRPHFNYVRPVDDHSANIALLNNDTYVYVRSSANTSVLLDIQNADKCLFNGKIVPDCNGSAWDLSQVNSGTECQENEFTVTAYRNDNQLKVSDSFYSYCPANDDFCAFGPQRYRPDEYRCLPLVSEVTNSDSI